MKSIIFVIEMREVQFDLQNGKVILQNCNLRLLIFNLQMKLILFIPVISHHFSLNQNENLIKLHNSYFWKRRLYHKLYQLSHQEQAI